MKCRIWMMGLVLFPAAAVQAQSALDGTWKGKTSQGKEIAITVKAGAVTSLKLGFGLKMDAPCVKHGSGPAAVALDYSGGEAETNYSKPLAITNGAFSATPSFGNVDAKLSGRFAPDEAKGELDLQASPASGCSGKARLTWSAARLPVGK